LSQNPEPAPNASAVGVVTETLAGEKRVALVPDEVAKLTGRGLGVIVQAGAGDRAAFRDEQYGAAGASLVKSTNEVLAAADVLTVVRYPSNRDQLELLKAGSVVVGLLDPFGNREFLESLGRREITAFAMEAIPRITRAQSMDALSSMSTVAGYRAVLLAAVAAKRMFPMLITAAGTQPPCRVLVLGAGVAGLQALATARRLGAVTQAFDTRPEVREQVQSVGATFIEMPELEEEQTAAEGGYAKEMSAEFYRREQDAIRQAVSAADAVITTALIPGRPAPVLITAEMARSMKPGSVIVDLAAEQGGNCELTQVGETVEDSGVTILGTRNLASELATQASQMYSRNVFSFLELLFNEARMELNLEDEILRAACVTRQEP